MLSVNSHCFLITVCKIHFKMQQNCYCWTVSLSVVLNSWFSFFIGLKSNHLAAPPLKLTMHFCFSVVSQSLQSDSFSCAQPSQIFSSTYKNIFSLEISSWQMQWTLWEQLLFKKTADSFQGTCWPSTRRLLVTSRSALTTQEQTQWKTWCLCDSTKERRL